MFFIPRGKKIETEETQFRSGHEIRFKKAGWEPKTSQQCIFNFLQRIQAPFLTEIATLSAAPEPVESLEVVPGPRSLQLRWHLPRHLHGDLLHFVLAARVVRGLGSESQEQLHIPDPVVPPLLVPQELPVYETSIADLHPATTYNVSVRCLGSGGLGSPATTLVTTTEE